MQSVYYLEGQANLKFEADNTSVISTDRDGILVECNFAEAKVLAVKWGLDSPRLANDGMHTSESGDVLFIKGGKLL